jgi:hypothetical protein
VNNN